MDRKLLMADLTQEEAFRPLVYDDKTGKDLRPGTVVQGNPTIAVGWNVSGLPCTPELGQIILGYWVDRIWSDVQREFPWSVHLPESVQRAMTDMAFNLRGAAQLATFTTFIGFLRVGKYAEAANDLPTTLWWKQVGGRGLKIQALILQGAE